MAAGLTFLVMRQVMPMAAGLASGLALSSFGVVSAALLWGFGSAARATGRIFSGRRDGDGRGRQGRNSLTRGAVAGLGRVARRWRENSVRRVRT
jgi:type IV secretion system protein VirB6